MSTPQDGQEKRESDPLPVDIPPEPEPEQPATASVHVLTKPSSASDTKQQEASGDDHSTWWSGWYSSAIEKSNQAFEVMRKDLSELSQVVHSESQSLINSAVVSSSLSAVSSTATYLKETVSSLIDEDDDADTDGNKGSGGADGTVDAETDEEREKKLQQQEAAFDQEVKEMLKIPETLALAATQKLTSVFNTIVDVLSPVGYDDDDVVILPGDQTIPRDRWDLLVKAIESDPHTYCHEPEGPPEDYESWLEKFNLMNQDVTRILQTSADVREFHDKLVPNDLSPDMFWHRYFYRIEMLRQLEGKRAQMLREREQEDQVRGHVSTGREDVTILSLKEEKMPDKIVEKTTEKAGSGTPATPEGKSSSGATSDEWEKTSLTDIVDEAAKRLADKLNTLPDTRSDEELNEWEFE